MKLIHSFIIKGNRHASVCIIMNQTLNNNVLRTKIAFFYCFENNDFSIQNTGLFPYHVSKKITFRCPKYILHQIELILKDIIFSYKNNIALDLDKKISNCRHPIINDSIKRKLLSFLLEQQEIMNILKDGQTIIQPILI